MDNPSISVDPPNHLRALGSEPSRDVARIEPDEVTDLDEWNPPLGDESPKVPLTGAQRLRELIDLSRRRDRSVSSATSISIPEAPSCSSRC
jgi:hypothetical protein